MSNAKKHWSGLTDLDYECQHGKNAANCRQRHFEHVARLKAEHEAAMRAKDEEHAKYRADVIEEFTRDEQRIAELEQRLDAIRHNAVAKLNAQARALHGRIAEQAKGWAYDAATLAAVGLCEQHADALDENDPTKCPYCEIAALQPLAEIGRLAVEEWRIYRSNLGFYDEAKRWETLATKKASDAVRAAIRAYLAAEASGKEE